MRLIQVLAPGIARGTIVRLAEPLSFWGGFDSETGRIIDRTHGDVGRVLTGAIVVMSRARGSSSSSSVLAEAIRRGTAPAAIVLGAPDPILPVGAIVAQTLYGQLCPIVVVDDVAPLATGHHVEIDTDRDLIAVK
jgi:uncharacterized protein